MDICERIKQIMEHEKLSVSQFSKLTGIGDQTLRTVVVMRRNKPGYDFLLKVISACEWLNIEWLMTGEGSMKKQPEQIVNSDTDNIVSTVSLEPLVKYMREKDEIIANLIKENTLLEVKYDFLTKGATR